MYFLVKFEKVLGTPFFTEHLRWLLLKETKSFYEGDTKVFLKTKKFLKGIFPNPDLNLLQERRC